MPSKPCKFGAVIFPCHCVITIRVFILGCILENQQTGESSSLSMSLKCFVTGLMWIKSVNSHSFAVS